MSIKTWSKQQEADGAGLWKLSKAVKGRAVPIVGRLPSPCTALASGICRHKHGGPFNRRWNKAATARFARKTTAKTSTAKTAKTRWGLGLVGEGLRYASVGQSPEVGGGERGNRNSKLAFYWSSGFARVHDK